MRGQNITAKCKWCGNPLPASYIGPCPKCGKKGKNISAVFNETISLSDSFNWELKRQYFEGHPKVKLIVFVITFGAPFLGLIFSRVVGVTVGLVFAIISYIFGPYAVTKVEKIKRGGSLF